MGKGDLGRHRPAQQPQPLPAMSGDSDRWTHSFSEVLQSSHGRGAGVRGEPDGGTPYSRPPGLPSSHSTVTATILTMEPCRLVALQV